MRQKVLPEDHPEIATSLNNLGFSYSILGDHQKSLEYYQKALKLFQKVLPKDHPDIASSLNNFGFSYSILGDHQKSLEYYQKALEMRQKVKS